METIFINTENSKTNESNKFVEILILKTCPFITSGKI